MSWGHQNTFRDALSSKAQTRRTACGTSFIGRSSDLQACGALRAPTWLRFPIPYSKDQCMGRAVRSCLPLRDSSGFSPQARKTSLLSDSLLARSGTAAPTTRTDECLV